MRRILLAAILALLPMPALADVTAHYSVGKDALLIESDDGGNSRIGIDGRFGIIRRDGNDYVVMTMPTGETKVAELSGLLALLSAAAVAEAQAGGPDGLKVEKFLLLDKGEAMVGARKGSLWSFGPETEHDGRPGKMIDVVISADPALAPIAAIFRRTVETLLPLLGAVIPEASGFASRALELTAKGAPIRIDKLAELRSIDTAEIDPARFELPAPVVEASAFLNAMRLGGDVPIEIRPLP